MKKFDLGMKFATAALAAGLMTVPMAYADRETGHSTGNGGDGIVLKGKRGKSAVVLYDLWERGVDARGHGGQATFSNEGSDAFATILLEIPEDVFFGKEGVALELAHALNDIPRSPAFVQRVLKELPKVKWVKAPRDLLPNPDTQPSVDLTGVNRIGCARHQDAQILVSPSCRDLMAPEQAAALVLHEIVYRIYLADLPRPESSFPVRTVTAAVFDTVYNETIDEALVDSGLGEIVERGRQLISRYGAGTFVRCVSSDAYLPEITLRRALILDASGKLEQSADWGGGRADTTFFLSSQPSEEFLRRHTVWRSSLPEFTLTGEPRITFTASNWSEDENFESVEFRYFPEKQELRAVITSLEVDEGNEHTAVFRCEDRKIDRYTDWKK